MATVPNISDALREAPMGVFCPPEAERMARREYQDPTIQTRTTPRGIELYIRYRVRVMKPEGIVRTEKRHPLGLLKEGANARNPKALTLAQAEREKAKIMARVNGQVYSFAAEIPFRDLIEQFKQNHLPTLSVPTQRQYRSWIAKHILPALGDRRTCDIRPVDLQAWFLALPVAETTRESIRGVLASIFMRAKEWEYIESVPFMPTGGRKKAAKRARPRQIPTPDEVRRILDDVRPDVRLVIETLLWTGLRISECLGLKPKHFDLERGVIHIEERQCRGDVDDPKSENGVRFVPLGELTGKYRAWLNGKSEDEYVFVDKKGRPYHDNKLLANYLTYRLVKLGLKFSGFGWHTFRRALATWMSESGATPFELMQQLGHADIRTSQLYVVSSNVKRRGEIVEKMQAEFAKGATA